MTRLTPALRLATGFILVAGLMSIAFLGGRYSVGVATSQADSPPAEAGAPPTWTVTEESIGRTLTFPGQIELPTVDGPLLQVSGIVTATPITSPATLDAGDPVLEVDLRPVVAAQGEVPAFRDLQQGDRGKDVAQLRQFLCDTGHLLACDSRDDFTSTVSAAVRAWQGDQGLTADGRIRASDIMWFETLPTRVVPEEGVRVGAAVEQGSQPVSVADGDARLRVEVTPEQVSLVPADAPVLFGDGIQGVVFGSTTARSELGMDGSERLRLDIRASSGEPVCSGQPGCLALLGDGHAARIEVDIEVVPHQTGLGVPVRALRSGADGRPYVHTPGGEQRFVEVLGSTGGVALVTGLELGEEIVIDPLEEDHDDA